MLIKAIDFLRGIINYIQLNLRDDEKLIRRLKRLGLYKNMDTINVAATDVFILIKSKW
ncbi:hypothetical protein [Clostridium sp. OS1-26]|uniref:hypothetical protein n=1 Tax=Clostridium sp. OS1-26 TaxID=3070681 RepID=UPI0027DF3FE3|nr:hypothetical protein [Clostridium sp. OS1-26]WML33527.1 hypothetical protein RCG18_19575 [Clostridium sp. OS1-26]